MAGLFAVFKRVLLFLVKRLVQIYFVFATAIISISILGHMVAGIQPSSELRNTLLIVTAFTLAVHFAGKDEQFLSILSQNTVLFYVLFAAGALLLDMSLDGTSVAHNALLNLSTELLGGAVILLIVNSLIRADKKNEVKLLETIDKQQSQMDRLESKIEKLELLLVEFVENHQETNNKSIEAEHAEHSNSHHENEFINQNEIQNSMSNPKI